MPNKKSKSILYIIFCLSTPFCWAGTQNIEQNPFYIGVIGGYGATTWQGLVPTQDHQNVALMLSTPIKVDEGGATWGVLGGYEFTPFFAIEANYMHYAIANVHFDQISLFSFLHDGSDTLSTHTESIGLMGKLLVPIPHSKMRIFSAAGAAGVHRKDIVVNNWRVGPSFGVGVNYSITERVMAELAGNFTAGYGESQLSPVDTYFPFLYSVAAHLIYRF
ncbi:MAG: outer membrane beta-barrel protein [Legionella longbeachae]|nr:outer membrane beta-barrel protein [Legionella longbeachae]